MTRVKYLLLILLLSLSLVGCTAQRLIGEGDSFYEQGQYEQAIQRYEAALVADPNSEEAREKLGVARAKVAELRVASARARLQEGDIIGAAQAIREAYDQTPESGVVLEVAADVASVAVNQSKQLVDDRQYVQGLELLGQVYEILEWKQIELNEPLRVLEVRWADDLVQGAADAEGRGHLGDALLMYAQASSLLLRPADVSKRDELRARLRSEGEYSVGLQFDGGTTNRKIAQTTLEGIAFVQNVKLTRERKGVDGLLKVSVGKASFSTSKSTRTESARYQDGTRQVPNPAYKSAEDDFIRREKDVFEREKDIFELEEDLAEYEERVAREGDTPGTSTSAEQGVSRTRSRLEYERNQLSSERDYLSRARERLADTPQTVEEPVMKTLNYSVTTHTRAGQLPVEVRVIHEDRRPTVKIIDTITTQTSDDTHKAYPIANVSNDPLNLESDSSMGGRMARAAGEVAAVGVERSVRARYTKMITEAKAIPEASERISLYVRAMLLDPTQVEEEILVELYETRGVADPVGVLFATE